ncbi:MAG TPA: AMP-binding protein [Bryobacteraceae bacterium]|nr:AMP-binding protein [Bryobacteraceae bacterium]
MAGLRRNLASLVDDFEHHGKDLAIVAPRRVRQRKTTYAELATLARRFAAELQTRGIVKGDRVLLWGENSAEWVAAFFGCVLRGVLPVPIDFAGNTEFARRVESEVAPKLIVGDGEKLAALQTSAPQLFLADFESAISTQTAKAIDDLSESDALQIVFTSGTTGEPKGIVHTHKNVLASLGPIETEMQKYLKYERVVHPVRFLHTLPLSHVFGQFMGLWIPPLFTAEVHYEPRLVAAELVERIRHERISVLASVPRVLDLLQDYVLNRFPDLATRLGSAGNMKALARWWNFRDVHRLFGLKFWAFVCGGASLSAAGEQFWAALGFVVVQGYGMTETTALVSLNHPFRPARGTIGQVLPGREVRLSDEGEVLVRGDTISNATWQHGHLQRQASEWLATGDLAEFDESGNLRFRGRKKDVIVTSAGLNIYPEDLEAALARQRDVKASTVVENETEHGPEPLAALVMNGGANPNAAVAQANRELAEFQQIQNWVVWPEPDFPRTSTGKVLRREVARRIASGEIEAASPNGAGGVQNLDSLGRVQLQARLEQQYGVLLDDNALQQVKTEEDVRKLVTQAAAGPADTPRARKKSAEHIYPHWPWNPVMHAIRVAFLELAAMPLVRLLAKPRVVQKTQQWPPGPVLMVANHVTSYDAPFVLYALPRRMRDRVAIAMSGEMILDFRGMRNQGNWFLNLLAPAAYVLITALFNVFPLPQLSGFRRSFRHAGEAVDRGYSVLVFPEGRRAEDETPQAFKPGAGLLWKELGTPALPVRIHGLGEIKSTHARWFRSGRIKGSVGAVLQLEAGKSPEELTEILWHAVFDD